MRLNDIEKRLPLVEGVQYGQKEESWVLSNLDKFRIGLEMELKTNSMEYGIDELEVIDPPLGHDTISDIADNSNSTAVGIVDGIKEYAYDLAEEMDGYQAFNDLDPTITWLLSDESLDLLTIIEEDEDMVKRFNSMRKWFETLHDTNKIGGFSDLVEYYMDTQSYADSSNDFYDYMYKSDFISVLASVIELLEMTDGVFHDNENVLDEDEIETEEALEYVEENNEVEFIIRWINRARESVGLSYFDKTTKELFDEFFDKFLSDLRINSLYENLFSESLPGIAGEGVDISSFEFGEFLHNRFGLPLNIIFDLGEPEVDTSTAEEVADGYETDFKVEEEADGQVEIITDGVITGDDIPVAIEESFEVVHDLIKHHGHSTGSTSGLHVSISMVNYDGPIDIVKFLLLSNILDLLPKDQRFIRNYVEDIRQDFNAVKAVSSLITTLISYRIYNKTSLSQGFAKDIENWAKTFAPYDKYRTVNFNTMNSQDGRIEIRMFGGEGYEHLEDMVTKEAYRSMYALALAGDKEVARKEYLQTLNAMVQDVFKNNVGMDLSEYFTLTKKIINQLDKLSKGEFSKNWDLITFNRSSNALNPEGLVYSGNARHVPVQDMTAIVNEILEENGIQPIKTLEIMSKAPFYFLPTKEFLRHISK